MLWSNADHIKFIFSWTFIPWLQLWYTSPLEPLLCILEVQWREENYCSVVPGNSFTLSNDLCWEDFFRGWTIVALACYQGFVLPHTNTYIFLQVSKGCTCVFWYYVLTALAGLRFWGDRSTCGMQTHWLVTADTPLRHPSCPPNFGMKCSGMKKKCSFLIFHTGKNFTGRISAMQLFGAENLCEEKLMATL